MSGGSFNSTPVTPTSTESNGSRAPTTTTASDVPHSETRRRLFRARVMRAKRRAQPAAASNSLQSPDSSCRAGPGDGSPEPIRRGSGNGAASPDAGGLPKRRNSANPRFSITQGIAGITSLLGEVELPSGEEWYEAEGMQRLLEEQGSSAAELASCVAQ
eukprot:284657-Prymnesium_polylepis.1